MCCHQPHYARTQMPFSPKSCGTHKPQPSSRRCRLGEEGRHNVLALKPQHGHSVVPGIFVCFPPPGSRKSCLSPRHRLLYILTDPRLPSRSVQNTSEMMTRPYTVRHSEGRPRASWPSFWKSARGNVNKTLLVIVTWRPWRLLHLASWEYNWNPSSCLAGWSVLPWGVALEPSPSALDWGG